jgi:hypothetical protein
VYTVVLEKVRKKYVRVVEICEKKRKKSNAVSCFIAHLLLRLADQYIWHARAPKSTDRVEISIVF